MEFHFGKFKGQTLEEVASQEEGRRWLDWLVSQPTDGKYAAQNRKRNEEIIAYLQGESKPVTKTPPPAPKEEPKEDLTAFQVIISKLDTIESLIRGSK